MILYADRGYPIRFSHPDDVRERYAAARSFAHQVAAEKRVLRGPDGQIPAVIVNENLYRKSIMRYRLQFLEVQLKTSVACNTNRPPATIQARCCNRRANRRGQVV